MGKTFVICCSIMRAVILISLFFTLFGALSSNDAPQESDVDGNLLKSYGIVETPVITDLRMRRSPVPAPARIKRSPKKNSKESESSEESGEELSGDGSDDTEDSSEEDD